jgi:hypothetical protein
MTPPRIARALLAVTASLAVAACADRRAEPTAEETAARAAEAGKNADPERIQELLHPAGEQVDQQNQAAMVSIANARCGRAERCQEVGSGKPFSDRDTCMTEVLDDVRVDLSAANCPGGIVQKELEECLAAIEAEDCDGLTARAEAIGRVIACRSSDMCKAIN